MSDACNKLKKGNSSKKYIECLNCHKRGHFSHDCPGPSGAKEGKQPPKGHPPRPNDSATNAANSMQDGTWSAIMLGPTKVLTPEYPPSSLFNDNDNYFDEMPEEANDTYLKEMPKEVNGSHTSSKPAALAYVVATPVP